MKPSKPNQISGRRPNRAATCVALVVIVLIGGSIIAYARRQSIRESWLQSQPIESLKSLDEQTDSDTLVHYVLASRLMSQAKPEEARSAAIEAAKSVAETDRSELAQRVFTLLAYMEARYGKVADAESSLRLAEQIGGDEAMDHLAKGLLADRQAQVASAIHEFAMATRLDTHLTEAWSRLAAAQIQVAEPDKAIIALRRAVEISPKDPQVHADLAEDLGRLAQYEEAAKECSSAAQLAPENPTFAVLPAIARASSARSDADYELAVQMLMADIQRFPEVDFFHELTAGLHIRFGRYEQARAELQPFLARNPANSSSWLNLSAVCGKLGDARAAAAAFAEYKRLIHLQVAPVEFEQQARTHPNDAVIFVKLSAAYHQAGKLREAYGAIVHAAGLRPVDLNIARTVTELRSEIDRSNDQSTHAGSGLPTQ